MRSDEIPARRVELLMCGAMFFIGAVLGLSIPRLDNVISVGLFVLAVAMVSIGAALFSVTVIEGYLEARNGKK